MKSERGSELHVSDQAAATATAPPLLRMEGIVKSFPGVKALRGVSLELQAGHVMAIVGENGAGKSSLIKTLSGAYEPDEGARHPCRNRRRRGRDLSGAFADQRHDGRGEPVSRPHAFAQRFGVAHAGQ